MPTINVGAPDPTLRNSPVLVPLAQEDPAPEIDEAGAAACYFNDQSFDHGTYVQSGDQLLRCEHGVWIVAGPEAPTVP